MSIVLVDEDEVWRLSQPTIWEQVYNFVLDEGNRLLFLSVPTPILGGAKE